MFFAISVRANEQNQVKKFIATINQDGVQQVTIVGGSYFFDNHYIIVKVNVPVELIVTKEPGFVPHDIVMKSPEAGVEFSQGLSITPTTITFTPTKVGKYPIFCSKKFLFFESHRDKGMKGILEVRE